MRYNKTIIGKCIRALHISRPKEKRDGHLCQTPNRKGNETGGNPSISITNGGYSLALGVCLSKCSNPLPFLLTPISLIQSFPFLIPIPFNSSLPISSLIPSPLNPISSPLTLRLIPLLSLYYMFIPLLCLLSLLPRNKHTPELPPFAPSPPYITLMKALRFAYMNLSLSILRHIQHITPSNYESRQIYL